jgi:hypothetical protein
MAEKKCNYLIGTRTRDHPACSSASTNKATAIPRRFIVGRKYRNERNGLVAETEPFAGIFTLSVLFYSTSFPLRLLPHKHLSFENRPLPHHWFLFIESRASVLDPLLYIQTATFSHTLVTLLPWQRIHIHIQTGSYQPAKLHGIFYKNVIFPLKKLITFLKTTITPSKYITYPGIHKWIVKRIYKPG